MYLLLRHKIFMKKMYTFCVLVHLHFMQQILMKLVSMNVHNKSCQVNVMLVYRALIKPLSCMNCRILTYLLHGAESFLRS